MMTLLYNIIQREPSVLSRHEASMLAQALVALKILPPALFSVLRTAVAQRRLPKPTASAELRPESK